MMSLTLDAPASTTHLPGRSSNCAAITSKRVASASNCNNNSSSQSVIMFHQETLPSVHQICSCTIHGKFLLRKEKSCCREQPAVLPPCGCWRKQSPLHRARLLAMFEQWPQARH